MQEDDPTIPSGDSSSVTLANSEAQSIALHNFAEKHLLGCPRVNYYPKNEPGQRWRLFLMGLTVGGGEAHGWGEELEDAYRDYIANIKGRPAQIYGTGCVVPKELTFL